jgi:hypothetical protein
MKKTLNIDDKLLREAKKACGAATDTETVRQGLEALVRRDAYQRAQGTRWQRAGCARRATAQALARVWRRVLTRLQQARWTVVALSSELSAW